MAQAAEPELAKWFILRRAVPEQHDANALVDPELGLKLPLDRAPPRITRLTAVTRPDEVARGELSIVGTWDTDLLLHERGRPTEPDNPDIFFLALDSGNAFVPDERAAAAGRSVFDVTATRLLDRTPGLPGFTGVRNVGFLTFRGPKAETTKVVAAELQAANRQPDNHVPFITLHFHRKNENDPMEWDWNQCDLYWPVVDDAAHPHWTTHDVIAHAEKLWWVNLSRGLVACDPVPPGNPQPRLEFVALPVLAGFGDRHEPAAQIDMYRTVGVSAGEMRFVDVARRRDDPEGDTRVLVWTLDLPPLIVDARWQDNPRETTLANIWNNAAVNCPQLPRDAVPVVALLHPDEPAVVFFFLNQGQYVFSVDVDRSAVVHFAEMPGEQGGGVPWPINHQRDVLAWKRTHFKTDPIQDAYERERIQPNQPSEDDQPSEDEDTAEG